MDLTVGRARLGQFFPLAPVWTILALNLLLAQIAAAAGGFVKTRPMSSVRVGHSATLLADGRVLVAGGVDSHTTDLSSSETIIASAELFNPSNGTWSATGALNFGRTYHTATLLPNGKVLVTGGGGVLTNENGSLSGTFAGSELYDPASGTWSMTGRLHAARLYHTATLMPDGKVLVVGGCKVSGSDPTLPGYYVPSHFEFFPPQAELYDPATGQWAVTGALKIGRVNHTTTLLTNGEVLVAGGGGINPPLGGIFSSAEIYDSANGKWTPTGSMTTNREDHTATLLRDGRVLVTGGISYKRVLSSCELFDPATGKWTLTGALKTGRMGHTATLLSDGRVLVAGGLKNRVLDPAFSAELYDPATGKWTATGAMKTGRLMQTATLLPDGRVLIAGGGSYMIGVADSTYFFIDVVSLAKAELFDPAIGRAR